MLKCYSGDNLVFLYVRGKANIKILSVCIILGLGLANEKKFQKRERNS